MTAIDRVTQYRNSMARRLRLGVTVRGLAIVLTMALCGTLAFAWLLARLDPSPEYLNDARVALIVCLGICAAVAVVIPVARLSPIAVARRIETQYPQFNQRLITLTECQPDPFLTLLAEDTLTIAREATPARMCGGRELAGLAGAGTAAMILLLWLIGSPHGAIASQAKALWTGTSAFSVALNPLHKTILQDSPLLVAAKLNGFSAKAADLHIRYAGSKAWQKIAMQQRSDVPEFVFRFERLSQSAELYATSEGVKSGVSVIRAIDLPHAQTADIAAPPGASVKVEIVSDRPMNSAELVMEPGDSLPLPPTVDNATSINLKVLRDALYHVSVRYRGELVQVSDEHAIEVSMEDKSHARPGPPAKVRTGPVPPGYESAVAEYFRRLSEVQGGKP